MGFKCITRADVSILSFSHLLLLCFRPFPAISLFSPLPSFALYTPLSSLLSLLPPTPVPRSFCLSPPQREWVSVWLSGEERWVLPYQILFQRNSSSEKHVCHQRANAGLLLQFHKQCGRARYAEIDVNPKTNKYTKGKQTSNVLPTLTPFNPEPCNETYSKMSEWEFPRPCKIYISVKTHKCTGTHVYLADPLFPLCIFGWEVMVAAQTQTCTLSHRHTHMHRHTPRGARLAEGIWIIHPPCLCVLDIKKKESWKEREKEMAAKSRR